MLIRTETVKKLNAISIAISLMEESNVSVAHFEINDLPEEEVKEIAKEKNVPLNRPNHFTDYYRIVIRKGVHTLTIRSARINTSLKAQQENEQSSTN